MTQKSARYWKGVVVAFLLPVFVSLPISWLIFLLNNPSSFASMIYGGVAIWIDIAIWNLYTWLRDKSKAA